MATAAVVDAATGQATRSQPVWYRAQVARDLTGSGRPDTLFLEARGPRPDSLHVVFLVRTDGREVYRQGWSTEYDFQDYDFPGEASARSDSMARIERRRLGAFLASERFAPLDTSQAKEPWEVGGGCEGVGDPRDCIAWYLRSRPRSAGGLPLGRTPFPLPARRTARSLTQSRPRPLIRHAFGQFGPTCGYTRTTPSPCCSGTKPT